MEIFEQCRVRAIQFRQEHIAEQWKDILVVIVSVEAA